MVFSGDSSEENALDGAPFTRRILREQIREFLVDSILKGKYKAGDRIVETRIAQDLGVSQGAVREALRELEWMGFLETKPFSGSFVRKLSADDLQEIYPVRAALEALGARLATPLLNQAKLDELRSLVDDMVRVSQLGDERGMVARNFAFHSAIMHASQNSALIRAWSMFQFSYWTSVATTELHEELVYLATRHYKILEALQSRDPELAASSMEEHLISLVEKLSHHKPHVVYSPDLR